MFLLYGCRMRIRLTTIGCIGVKEKSALVTVVNADRQMLDVFAHIKVSVLSLARCP